MCLGGSYAKPSFCRMKIFIKKGVFYALFLTSSLFADPFVVNDDKILNEQVSLKLESIGAELKQKTDVKLVVAAFENLNDKSLEQAFKEQNLSQPYVFLILEKAHKKVEIFADDTSLRLFDKEQVLSPFPESGTILPILVSNKGKDVYNAALLNGYADIAEQIAKSKKVELQTSIGNANKNVLNSLRIFFYASIVVVLGFMIYKRKVKNG
ncbi:hypothetical protein [Campylobacter suis]|nr:hypothetical protein [Campylobacter suis]